MPSKMLAIGLDRPGTTLEYLEAPFKDKGGFEATMERGFSWHQHTMSTAGSPEAHAQLQTSLAHVVAFVQENGAFDGVYGFSQVLLWRTIS